MDHAFGVQEREKGDVMILDLSGSLTIGSGDQELKSLVSDLSSRGVNNILINLQYVEFMDSTGIGAIVKSYATLTNKGGRLKLLNPSKLIRHSLKVIGLLGIFEVFDDEAQALASF